MIYKELMLMGMLTFCVMMYEAIPKEEEPYSNEEWLASIDFSHVYLFFVTFFFVLHAFYFMMMSVSAVSEYRLMFSEKTAGLIGSLQEVRDSCLGSFLFSLKLLPLSKIRYHAEFSLLQSLFTKIYKLPEDLDFPYYLSGCFDRFALRTINRSMFTWVVLLFIVACNYARIRYRLGRRVVQFFLSGTASTASLLGAEQSEVGGESESGSEGGGEDGDIDIDTAAAASAAALVEQETLFIFMGCGIVLIIYTILLTIISRIYKMR